MISRLDDPFQSIQWLAINPVRTYGSSVTKSVAMRSLKLEKSFSGRLKVGSRYFERVLKASIWYNLGMQKLGISRVVLNSLCIENFGWCTFQKVYNWRNFRPKRQSRQPLALYGFMLHVAPACYQFQLLVHLNRTRVNQPIRLEALISHKVQTDTCKLCSPSRLSQLSRQILHHIHSKCEPNQTHRSRFSTHTTRWTSYQYSLFNSKSNLSFVVQSMRLRDIQTRCARSTSLPPDTPNAHQHALQLTES